MTPIAPRTLSPERMVRHTMEEPSMPLIAVS